MTSLDLTPAQDPRAILMPITGEVIDLARLDAPELAQLAEQSAEYKRQLDAFLIEVSEEIHARMDAQASWTLHAGLWKLTGKSPEAHVEWDVEQLRAELLRLTQSGEIDPDAAERAIRVKTTLEVAVAGVKALMKLGGPVAQAIEGCRRPSPRPRRVRVERAR